jgi:hypothetical protein
MPANLATKAIKFEAVDGLTHFEMVRYADALRNAANWVRDRWGQKSLMTESPHGSRSEYLRKRRHGHRDSTALVEWTCHDLSRFKERRMAEPITLEVFSDYV